MHLADMAALGTVKAECERQVRILLNGCFDLMHVTRRTGTPTNSIRLWIPRSVALHKIQIKILLLWICPRHFAVCVGKALGIRIRLKCGVSAQPFSRCFKHVPSWLHWSFDHQPIFFQVGHFNALRQAKRLFFQQGYKKASKSLRPTSLGNVLVEGFFPR